MQGYLYIAGAVAAVAGLVWVFPRLPWKKYPAVDAARRCFAAAGIRTEVVKKMLLGGLLEMFVRAEYGGMLWEVSDPGDCIEVCVRPPEAVRYDPTEGERPLLGVLSTEKIEFSGGTDIVLWIKMGVRRYCLGWREVANPGSAPAGGLWRYARGGFHHMVVDIPAEMSEGIATLTRFAEKHNVQLVIQVWPDRTYYTLHRRSEKAGLRSARSDESVAELIEAIAPLAQWRWTEDRWTREAAGHAVSAVQGMREIGERGRGRRAWI